MDKHKDSQRGDITVLLAIVGVLLIIGAVVWVVWLRPSSAQNTQSSGSNQASTSTTSSNSNSSDTTSGNPTEQSGLTYIAVEKWGVKVPIVDGMGNFEFSINNDGIMLARSKALDDLSRTCTDNSVLVVRGKAGDKVIGEMGYSDTTFKQAYDVADTSTLSLRSIKAHVGEYYYVVPGISSASCAGDSQTDQQKEQDAQIAIVKAINQMVAQ